MQMSDQGGSRMVHIPMNKQEKPKTRQQNDCTFCPFKKRNGFETGFPVFCPFFTFRMMRLFFCHISLY